MLEDFICLKLVVTPEGEIEYHLNSKFDEFNCGDSGLEYLSEQDDKLAEIVNHLVVMLMDAIDGEK